MSVHQSCYGIDVIPDGEWYCIPCTVIGWDKSRNLKCALCPKYGGAMWPSATLSRDSIFMKFGTTYLNN